MKISKTSWHYRLMVRLYDHEWQIPADLCRYVRALLWRSFLHAVFIAVMTVLACEAFVVFVLTPLATLAYYWGPQGWVGELQAQADFGVVIWAVYAAALVGALVSNRLAELRNMRRMRSKLPPREPSIFTQRYRDWRAKVCTQLSFH
jgi:hypothetical protein